VEKAVGRWTFGEQAAFVRGLSLYDKDWKRIQQLVKTRSLTQIRTHAQKYFRRLASDEVCSMCFPAAKLPAHNSALLCPKQGGGKSGEHSGGAPVAAVAPPAGLELVELPSGMPLIGQLDYRAVSASMSALGAPQRAGALHSSVPAMMLALAMQAATTATAAAVADTSVCRGNWELLAAAGAAAHHIDDAAPAALPAKLPAAAVGAAAVAVAAAVESPPVSLAGKRKRSAGGGGDENAGQPPAARVNLAASMGARSASALPTSCRDLVLTGLAGDDGDVVSALIGMQG
jgi:SHAQKYF class myb-like DNA-binding protein